MYVAFLTGGTASGKSVAARELERLGARRVDLDELSREVLAPGAPVTRAVADAFGADLLDASTGALDRAALAARAFATPEATARLEALELPAIVEALRAALASARAAGARACVVEVPLPDRLDAETLALADEVVAIACPLGLRRVRAVARGMAAADFDVRVARQPDDAWPVAHADTVIDNSGAAGRLLCAVRAWWDGRIGHPAGFGDAPAERAGAPRCDVSDADLAPAGRSEASMQTGSARVVPTAGTAAPTAIPESGAAASAAASPGPGSCAAPVQEDDVDTLTAGVASSVAVEGSGRAAAPTREGVAPTDALAPGLRSARDARPQVAPRAMPAPHEMPWEVSHGA